MLLLNFLDFIMFNKLFLSPLFSRFVGLYSFIFENENFISVFLELFYTFAVVQYRELIEILNIHKIKMYAKITGYTVYLRFCIKDTS